MTPIRLFGDPVLRTPADPVTTFDKELRRLVKDLTESMLDADGAGLAAPHLGSPKGPVMARSSFHSSYPEGAVFGVRSADVVESMDVVYDDRSGDGCRTAQSPASGTVLA